MATLFTSYALSDFIKTLVYTTILARYIIDMSKTSRTSNLQEELGKPYPFQMLEQETYLNLVRTHAVFDGEIAELFKQYQLSQPLYNVLKVVARMGEEGMPSQSIAQYMVTRDPDITRLVDRLQKDGLIERERDERDRRVVRIRITPSGLQMIQQLDPLIWDLHHQQFGHLDKEKLKLLNDLLVEARSRA
jgi:DNA-binding MarR family transcriptional regulator